MTTPWREIYPVHPCADQLPELDKEELKALAVDIKANGLKVPISLWRDASVQPERVYLLDGRSRLDALALNGEEIPLDSRVFRELDIQDPAACVISLNIRRRHLTNQQRAELIAKVIEAGKNDRATPARSFSPTTGTKGGSTKDPLLAAAIEEGAKHDVSKRSIQRARAKLGISKHQSARKAKGWTPEQLENARRANQRAKERKVARQTAGEPRRVDVATDTPPPASPKLTVEEYRESQLALRAAIDEFVKSWPTPARECVPRMLWELAASWNTSLRRDASCDSPTGSTVSVSK